MSDDFYNASRFYRFTIPPLQLDSPIPRPGPYLFHALVYRTRTRLAFRTLPPAKVKHRRGNVYANLALIVFRNVTRLQENVLWFFYWLTPTSLKQNMYLKSDAETQIYSKNGEWIHFNIVVYLDNLHANTCYFTKKYYQMTSFCIN